MPLELGWSHHEGADCLRLSGWAADDRERLRAMASDAIARRFPLYPSELLNGGERHSLPPVAGRYVLDGDGGVCFVPRFPFLSGTEYAMVIDDGQVLTVARPSDAPVPTTSVVEVYPTAAGMPFNQLKLYVHFSAPMSEGYAERCIAVVDAEAGAVLPAAFLPMDTELWDGERRRLTVLFDPARIKRGLAPHREIGHPLQPGRRVRVVVDGAYRDAKGAPLVAAYSREYAVEDAVRAKVDPAAWRVRPPQPQTHDALAVEFDRPLDHALLQHCLTLIDRGSGSAVRGTGRTGPLERSWLFTPAEPWPAGEYAIAVDPILEDLAGNSVARVFDRDLNRREDDPLDDKVARITIDFAIQ